MKKIITITSFFALIILCIYLFVDSNKINNNSTSEKDSKVLELKDGRQCYTYSHEATSSEPYRISEFIDISITNNSVTGTKTGTQEGPDMTNGYSGKIVGTLENNTINATFSYMIEGSKGSEKEIYKAGVTGIDKVRYPLIEKDKILVPDTTKDFKLMHYSRVGCEGSN